jgi:eukaryotic-like serine/threonine-protein kinase
VLRGAGAWLTQAKARVAVAGRKSWLRGRGGAPRYTRVLELGNSHPSSVWAAVARSADDVCKMVALKGVCTERASDRDARQRLIDEARLTARMNHPNVVATHGLQREGAQPVIVMEYLEGQSLETLLASANDLREFPLELRISIVARLLRGLDYVHRLRDFDGRPLHVVHGDVSPENVFVTYDGEVKLIDFGRARSRAPALENPLARRRLLYTPPEELSGDPDLRGDIFSVGVILWELVANRPLWGRIPASTLVRRLLAGDIPRLRDVVPTVDGELDRICARALAPHPDGRFSCASDLRDELDHYLTIRRTFVTDTTIGALVCKACRELRHVAQKAVDARIAELGLSLPPATLAAPPATALQRKATLERRQRRVAASIVAAAILVAVLLCVTLRREPSAGTMGNEDAATAASAEAPLPGARATGPLEVAAGEATRARLDPR